MKIFSKDAELQNGLLDRFLRYVKIESMSSSVEAEKGVFPSTECQRDFAKILLDEIKAIGLKNAKITKDCYVYAVLPATKGMENVPPFCLISHLDTVDEVSGKDVKPIIHASFDGAKIDLKDGVCLDITNDEFLALAAAERDTIITSDGTTLLGSDDKAGVSEIVSALEYIKNHKEIKHGMIEILFSPDEETGHGMDYVPLDLLKSKMAYTVDGGHIGQLEAECFNAVSATVNFSGKSTHTGDARKNGMVNANHAMARFISSIPVRERPETTDGDEGFFAVMESNGTVSKSTVRLLIRDFSRQGLVHRVERLKMLASVASDAFGATYEVEIKEQYSNMKTYLDNFPLVVQNLQEAYMASGVEYVMTKVRGGTDGSQLSEMGIPTPNIFTGGHNFHSKKEWASLSQMCSATDVLINLAAVVVLRSQCHSD